MFTKIGLMVSRIWPVLLVAWAAALAVALWLSPPWDTVVLDREFAYMPDDVPSRQGEAAFKQAFPYQYNPSALTLVVYREDAPLTAADLKFIEEKLKPGVLRIAADEGGLASAGTASQSAPSIIAAVHTWKEAGIGPLLLSVDRRASLVVVELTTEMLQLRNRSTLGAIDKLLERVRREGAVPSGLAIVQSGSAATGRDITRAEARSVVVVEYCTLLFVVVLLLAIYRSPLLTLVPLVTMFVAVQFVLKMLALAAKFSLITVFEGMQIYIIIVMYGTGVDYCLFLLSRCKEELESGQEAPAAVASAIGKVGVPLTASAATVAVGIGMMSFANFGEYHYAGIAIFFSLLVGWLAALTLTPAMLRLLGQAAFGSGAATVSRSERSLWNRLAGQLRGHPATILLAAVLMMIPFGVVALLNADHLAYDLQMRLPKDAPSRVGTRILREHFAEGLTAPVIVLLNKPGFRFDSDEGQDAIDFLTQGLMRQRKELGVADLRTLSQPLGSSQAAQNGIEGEIQADTSQDPQQQALTYFVSGSATQVQLVLKGDPLSRHNLDLMDHLESAIRSALPENLKDAGYHVLGYTSSIHDLRQVTMEDEKRIQLLVVACVFAIFLLLLRRLVVALYLIVSVLLSYCCTLGVTYTLFWALDPSGFDGLDWKVPIFLFVILMAIGADYNIFLLTRVYEEEENLEPVSAVASALVKTARIITSCGIIMAGTFASLLSSSLVDLTQLGFALSFGILLDTFMVRPILVPAFLILIKARLRKKKKTPLAA